jgi:hypothetical protein
MNRLLQAPQVIESNRCPDVSAGSVQGQFGRKAEAQPDPQGAVAAEIDGW